MTIKNDDDKWLNKSRYSKFWDVDEDDTGDTNSNFWLKDKVFTRYSSFFDEESKVDYFMLSKYLRAITNFVYILTRDQSISVRYSSGSSSYTNDKEVTISSKIDENKFDVTVGLALHEASHIVYTDFDVFRNFMDKKSVDTKYDQTLMDLYKTCFNIVEDRYIDFMTYESSPGYRGYYSALYKEYFGSELIEKAFKLGMWNQPTLENYLNQVTNIVNPSINLKALPGLQEIYDILDVVNIKRMTTTKDRIKLSEKIAKIILDNIDQEELKSKSNGGQGVDGEGGDEEGEITVIFGGGGPSEDGKLPNYDNVKPLTKTQLKKLLDIIKAQKDLINDTEKLKKGKLSRKDSDFVQQLVDSDIESKSVTLNDVEIKVLVVNSVNKATANSEIGPKIGMHRNENSIYNNSNRRKTAVNDGIKLGRFLAKKLQLRNEVRTLESNRLKSGKIDKRLLNEIGFDNYQIFKKIDIHQYEDVYIHLTLDQSGSMASQWPDCLKIAAALGVVGCTIPNVRVVVSARSTCSGLFGGSKENPYIVTMFDSAKNNIHHIREIFPLFSQNGLTPEGLTFSAIMDVITQHSQNKNAFFINLCDGQPTCQSYDGFNAINHTKEQRLRLEKAGIKVLSYYIEPWTKRIPSDFVTMYGKKNSFIISPDNIVSLLAKTINDRLLEM